MADDRIGWVGLGAMGRPMARRLVDHGHRLVVYSRSGLLGDLEDSVEAASSPADLAALCRFIVTIVGGPADVEELYLGERGFVSQLQPNSVVVDHTTGSPELARRIAVEVSETGSLSLDAPVSGGPSGAASGELSVMAGGTREALARAAPILECFARRVVLIGGPGTGQLAKLTNQIVVAGTMLAIRDAWLFAFEADLPSDKVSQVISDGVVGSPLFTWAWSRIADGDMVPGFQVDHLVKDLRLVREQGKSFSYPLVSAALEVYEHLSAGGHGEDGTQVIASAS